MPVSPKGLFISPEGGLQNVYTVYIPPGRVKKKYAPADQDRRGIGRKKNNFYQLFTEVFSISFSMGKISDVRAVSLASSLSAGEWSLGILRT
jgi:hypothetical protein